MEKRVSVIVPVYNTGKYLAKCLDTLLSQTLQDIEVICINDGSTDNSLEILEAYQKFDNRVKLINLEHSGLSAARNAGLNAACGEYIMFVNSDDYIASQACEILYNNAKKNNSDVVLFDFVWKNPGAFGFTKTTIKEFKNYYKDAPFSADKMGSLSYKLMPVPAWTKLYKAEFLNDKIKFLQDNIYADIPFWAEVYTKAERITYVTEPLYFYSLGRNDAISLRRDQRAFDIIEVYEASKKIFKKNGYWKQYKDSFFALMMPDLLNKFNIILPEYKEQFFHAMKSMNKDINYRIYDSEFYTDNEKRAANVFDKMRKDDYFTFLNLTLGGYNE